ncbi:hypothetical protein E6O75_ATG00506 [Venturia nashicola]|uniref:Uncharacterized protein n=1 Tax=Venturia nashicola TaxID=86259 RepID=A0A4Z1PNH8_9PEZI|nr:hypothetical protein E6O75_ATG00506 [Venturia nashicola]
MFLISTISESSPLSNLCCFLRRFLLSGLFLFLEDPFLFIESLLISLAVYLLLCFGAGASVAVAVLLAESHLRNQIIDRLPGWRLVHNKLRRCFVTFLQSIELENGPFLLETLPPTFLVARFHDHLTVLIYFGLPLLCK